MAEIDGQPVHFFHIKSKEAHAMPLMLLHGWPSSNVEFVKIIDDLVDPVAHGGKAGDAFHVVLPTIPGFGLSSPLREHWDSLRTAGAYSQLMKELGYEKWGVHGGDVGSDIAGEINHIDTNLVGVHISTDMPAIIWYAVFTGKDPVKIPDFSVAEKKALQELMQKGREDGGYLEIQRTRPSTIGYLLNDSPLATNLHAQRDWSRPSLAPIGMAVFSAKSTARALQDPEKQLAHWSEFKEGGHFPAMEVPGLLVADLRKFFHRLR